MTDYANMEKIGSNYILSIPSISDSAKFNVFIHLLEITIKVGKHFPIIILSMISLNLLLAANDFFANSINFAILNSMFAIGGFVSLVQLYQSRKTHPLEYNSNFQNIQNKKLEEFSR